MKAQGKCKNMLYNINMVSCCFLMVFFRLKSCNKAKKRVHSSVKLKNVKYN